MRVKSIPLAMSAGLALACLQAGAGFLPARAQTPELAGQVTSAEEGPMEGVLVSAKKTGSNITVTVVSDKEGRYSFPATRLEPGAYTISVRAVGYELTGKPSTQIGRRQGSDTSISSCARRESSRPSSRMPNGSSARPARSSRSSPTTTA